MKASQVNPANNTSRFWCTRHLLRNSSFPRISSRHLVSRTEIKLSNSKSLRVSRTLAGQGFAMGYRRILSATLLCLVQLSLPELVYPISSGQVGFAWNVAPSRLQGQTRCASRISHGRSASVPRLMGRPDIRGVLAARGCARNEGIREAIVVDFDGVVCDSFHERVRVAYQASLKKWPDVMKQVTISINAFFQEKPACAYAYMTRIIFLIIAKIFRDLARQGSTRS
jgi:hypothetical protein